LDFDRLQAHLDNTHSHPGIENHITYSPLIKNEDNDKTKADKNANFDDFIEMLARLVTKSGSMRSLGVEFSPDEGRRVTVDVNTKLDNPLVAFELIEKVPDRELKPMERETIQEPGDDRQNARSGRIYGQKFNCLVQFNVFAAEYTTANAVIKELEALISSYIHVFKRDGVREVLYSKRFTDRHFDNYRQFISVRNVQYLVQIEQLHVVWDTEISAIIES